MIIAVSDTHLGYDQSDSTKFLKFIDSELMNLSNDDHLVLLGDILEFWRGKNIDTIFPNYIKDDNEKKKEQREINEQIFSRIMELNTKTKLHYIIGNHDYTVINFLNNYNKNFLDNRYPIEIRKACRLKEGNLKIFFMHGYEFEVISSFEPLTIEDYEKICIFLCDRTGKLVGKKLSFLWDLFNNRLNIRRRSLFKINSITKPPEERRKNIDNIKNMVESSAFRQFFFGIRDDEVLVFGHTHRPFISLEKNVVNTGSWLKYAEGNCKYLKIKDDKIELLDYQ
jgi:UDP-2,3-diacylglucosamine pyrophosphatase LpxH